MKFLDWFRKYPESFSPSEVNERARQMEELLEYQSGILRRQMEGHLKK